MRGDIMISDVQRNIERMRRDIHMVYWNEEGFKVGLCTVPPVSQVQEPHATASLQPIVLRKVAHAAVPTGDGVVCLRGIRLSCTLPTPSPHQPQSLLCLANNCAVRYPLRYVAMAAAAVCCRWESE